MGLFDSLLDKGECAVCGGELGLLAKHMRKLDDGGHICKDCENKFSPFFTGRRASNTSDIRRHLIYRDNNAAKVAEFNPSITLNGESYHILIDEEAQRFMITRASNWRDANPDVISLNDIIGVETRIDESKIEQKYKDEATGEEKSYRPPRYDYDYDFYLTVNVDSEWFNSVTIKVNSEDVDRRGSQAYREAERLMNEMKEKLETLHASSSPEEQLDDAERMARAYEAAEAEAEAAKIWTCACGVENNGNFCKECGAKKPAVGPWTCECGQANDDGKFCQNCGAKRPE